MAARLSAKQRGMPITKRDAALRETRIQGQRHLVPGASFQNVGSSLDVKELSPEVEEVESRKIITRARDSVLQRN